jgi:hypothetical protein
MWLSLYPGPSVVGAQEVSSRCRYLNLLAWLPRFPSWEVMWEGVYCPLHRPIGYS